MRLKHNQTGFGATGIILAIVALGVVGAAGWFVYHSQHKPTQVFPANQTSDYAACVKAEGSKVLTTYPEQCVTAAGKTYTNPAQKTQTPPQN